MKITSKWLEKQFACPEGKAWFLENFKKETTLKKLIEGLIKAEKWSWSEWLIQKSVNQKQAIRVAIFSAELVIDIYEKKYPEDKRPRQAIEAAKAYLKKPNEVNKNAAANAALAAYAAAAALAADYAAAYAAYAAAYAAADDNAAYAAYAAAYAAKAANVEIKSKCAKFVIALLKKKKPLK